MFIVFYPAGAGKLGGRVTSRHVASRRVASRRVASRRVVSCRVLSCPVLSCPVVSCRVVSCHFMSWHVMAWHVMSCHFSLPVTGSRSHEAGSSPGRPAATSAMKSRNGGLRSKDRSYRGRICRARNPWSTESVCVCVC